MDKNQICEALYALPSGVVIKRHKPVFSWSLILLAGAALLALNTMIEGVEYNNIKSAIVFIGSILALTGGIMIIIRLLGSGGEPYYKPARKFMQYREMYFPHNKAGEILKCINEQKHSELRAIPQIDIPSVAVIMYHTDDDALVACQAFEYIDLDYRPLCELKIKS